MNVRRLVNDAGLAGLLSRSTEAEEREVLNEESFQRMIAVERKRTERSGEPFLLMLLEPGSLQVSEKNGKPLNKIMPALLSSTRETDVIGWCKDQATVGAIFTGLLADEKNSILSTILTRMARRYEIA